MSLWTQCAGSRGGHRLRGRATGVWLVLVVLASMIASVSANAQVLLNEIMADPAQDWDGDGVYQSRDDEWVEIVNVGSTEVSLEGYRLASADTTWRFEFDGTLAAGGVRVVYGSESYLWEQANGYPAYGLRLTNTGSTIALWQLAAQDTLQLDVYSYLDHEADDDRSTGRLPDGAGEWRVFDAMNAYSGTDPPLGSGCSPSPGAVVNCPLPVKSTTWGAIKTLYARPLN